MSSLTIYAASDNQIYSVTKQVRKNFSASLPEFSPLIECYENPFTVLRVMPSQSSRILETSRGYSFIYCLRDVITKVNIGGDPGGLQCIGGSTIPVLQLSRRKRGFSCH